MDWRNTRFLCVDDEEDGLRTSITSLTAAGVPSANIVPICVKNSTVGQGLLHVPATRMADVKKALLDQYVGDHCTVAVVDLQLNVGGNGSWDQGSDVTRHLTQHAGLRYAIWLTKNSKVVENPVEQVVHQVGVEDKALSVIDCPRVYFVNKAQASRKMALALQYIHQQMTEGLARAEYEWALEAYQLERIYRKLKCGTDSIAHGLDRASPDEIADLEAFDMVPHSDPPSPLGLWIEMTRSAASGPLSPPLLAEVGRSATRGQGEQGEGESKEHALQKWLHRHLFGLPLEEIPNLVKRLIRSSGVEASQVDPSIHLDNSGMVYPCSRRTFSDALGTALRNAAKAAARTDRNIILLDARVYGDGLAAFTIANLVSKADLDGFKSAVAGNKLRPRGLLNLCIAVDDLNQLTGVSKAVNPNRWSYQMHIWDDQTCLSEGKWVEVAKPGDQFDGRFFRRGSPPDPIANGHLAFFEAIVPKHGCCVTVTVTAPWCGCERN